MSTGQFPGKDPRASVALKDPRATASGRPVVVAPGPQKGGPPEPGSGMRKVIAIGVVVVVLIAIANVIYFSMSANKEAAEQIKAEDTTNATNEAMVRIGELKAQLATMQNTINQQGSEIKQLRSEVVSSKNSVDSVRSLYIQQQSTPVVNQPPKDPNAKGPMR